MSGHSKWANTKHRKSRQDRKKGRLFSKIIHELSTASKAGNDVKHNARLRAVVQKAHACNMNKRIIRRALHGPNETHGAHAPVYEGYGPGRVAVLVRCVTDNPNRTSAQIRRIFSKIEPSFVASIGAVRHLFVPKGMLMLPHAVDEDDALDLLEADVDDFIMRGPQCVGFYTNPAHLHAVENRLRRRNLPIASSEIVMVPIRRILVEDTQQRKDLRRLLRALRQRSDVAQVFHDGNV